MPDHLWPGTRETLRSLVLLNLHVTRVEAERIADAMLATLHTAHDANHVARVLEDERRYG